MTEYRIEVKLITESIFGSGYSIPSEVDLEVVTDEYGLPYMKAKTFKGNFREAMEEIVRLVGKEKYGDIVDKLLGKGEAGLDQWKTLKFSDMRLAKNIRAAIEKAVSEGKIEPQEIKEALTEIRSFTSVDEEGSSKKGSLRHLRVIKKGLIFEVDLYTERNLTEEELGILAMTTSYLRHIGTMRTRGKGEIQCCLLEKVEGEFVDCTNKYIDRFFEGVRTGA